MRRLREPDGRALLLYRVTVSPHDLRDVAAVPTVTAEHDVAERMAPATDRPAGGRTESKADG